MTRSRRAMLLSCLAILLTLIMISTVVNGQAASTTLHAQACKAAAASNLATIPSMKFNNAQPGLYSMTSGITLDANGFSIQPDAGSSAAINFATKINLASGVEISFRYQVPTPLSKSTTGFALMFQNVDYDQRDGSNEHLGYRLVKTAAIEFDYYSDSGDCPGQHIMFSTSPNPDTQASYACPSGSSNPSGQFASWTSTKGPTTVTMAAGATYDVTVSIFQNDAGTGYDIIVKHGSQTITIPNKQIFNAHDIQGASWFGFTSSAIDSTTSLPFRISNVVVKTAGVDKVSSWVPAVTTPGWNAAAAESVATDAFDSLTAFNGLFKLQDKCGRTVRSITEELKHLVPRFTSLPPAAVSDPTLCAIGPFTPSTIGSNAGQEVVYPARIGCKSITGTNPQTSLTTTYAGGTAQSSILALTFISGPAVARSCEVTKVTNTANSAVLCASTAACSAAGLSASVVAGSQLAIEISFKDQYGNRVTGQTTQVAATLNLTPSPPAQSFTNTATATYNFTPLIVTSNALLSITVNNQLLTSSTLSLTITHAVAHGPSSVITSGTGLAQYIAGTLYPFVLNLKDQYGNVVTTTPAANVVEFTLRWSEKLASCDNTSQTTSAADGFNTSNKCPTAWTRESDGFVTFSGAPTVAGGYFIVCKVNGVACSNLGHPNGYSISVVAADEDVTKAELTSTAPVFKYTTAPSVLSTFTTSDGEALNSQYLTVNSMVSLGIKSFDSYGNERTTQLNAGQPYEFRVYRVNGAFTSVTASTNYNTIRCDSSAPVIPATPSQQFISGQSLCRFSATSGYTIELYLTKTAYLSWLSLPAPNNISIQFGIVQAKSGTVFSTNQYFSVVQAALPASGASANPAVAFTKGACANSRVSTTTQAVAGCKVTYSVAPVDSFSNLIEPLWSATNAGSATVVLPVAQQDYNQRFFQVTHSLLTLNPIFNPVAVNGFTSNQRVVWTWADSKWSTEYTYRGAVDTTPTFYFKTASWSVPAITVLPNVPTTGPIAITATRWTSSYSKPETGSPTYTMVWSLYDIYGNPSYFETVPSPNLPTKVTTTGSCGDMILSGGCATGSSNTKCTVTSTLTALSSSDETCTLSWDNVEVISPQRSITWPAQDGIRVRVAYMLTDVAPSATVTPSSNAWTASSTPTDQVAGKYVIFRFQRQSGTRDISQALLSIDFIVNGNPDPLAATPATTPLAAGTGDAASVYIAYRLTVAHASIAFDAKYSGTAAFWSTLTTPTTPDPSTVPSPTVKVIPAKLSLSQSMITTPAEIVACSATTTAANVPTINRITLSPYDEFGNLISYAAAAGETVQFNTESASPYKFNVITGTTQLIWGMCVEKAEFFQFSIQANGESQTLLTVVVPGPPSVFKLESTASNCLSPSDSCVSCSLGVQCTVRAKLYDAFNNPLTSTDMASRGTISTSLVAPSKSLCTQTLIDGPRAFRADDFDETVPTTTATFPQDPTHTNDLLTLSIAGDFFQTPSTTYAPDRRATTVDVQCSEYKHVVFKYTRCSGAGCNAAYDIPVGQSVENQLNLNMGPAASPTYWLVQIGSNSFYRSHQTGQSTTDGPTTTALVASSTPAQFRYTFYDSNFNIWPVTLLQVQGTFTGTLSGTNSQSVPLMSSATANDTAIFALPQFTQANTFRLSPFIVAGQSLIGMRVPVVPGAITRWDFTFPSFGKTFEATDVFPTDTTGYEFFVNAIPYDANNNKVSDGTAITNAVAALQFLVFEGATTCDTTTMLPSALSTAGSQQIANHNFAAKLNSTTTNTDGAVQILIRTQRANTLTVAGTRLSYTYYFANNAATRVYTCTGATVNIVPTDISLESSSVAGLTNSAIRAGEPITFAVTLRDKFSNVIAFTPENPEKDYEYEVVQCTSGTPDVAEILCDKDEEDCSIATVPGYTAASFTLAPSASTALTKDSKSEFSIRVKQGSTTDVLENGSAACFSINVYHSFPNTVQFVDIDQPRLVGDDTKLNPISSLTMTAGVPTTFALSSLDIYQNIIDYNRPAFIDPVGQDPLFYINNFTVNQMYYYVTATFTSPLSGTSDLIYATTANSTVPEFTPSTDGAIHSIQTITLLPAWPGIYTITARAFNSTTHEPVIGRSSLDTNGVQIFVALNPSITLTAASPICDADKVYIPNAVDPSVFGTCVAKVASTDKFFCYSSTAWQDVLISSYDLSPCECSTGYTKCGNRCLVLGVDEECPTTVVPTRVCPANYYLCGDMLTCAATSDQCNDPANLPVCPVGQIMCFDGSCASSETNCATPTVCGADQFLCPNNLCVSKSQYCQQVRECNDDSNGVPLRRCPSDGSCVQTLDQCPTTSSCPLGSVKCSSGQCAASLEECPSTPLCTETNPNAPFRCPNGSCVVDATFCPSGLSCGTEKPILCPDRRSCVKDVADCNVVQECPEGTILCASGDCKVAGQCPTSPTCRPEQPVMCTDSSCVTAHSDCNTVDEKTVICPADAPIKCGSGNCAKHAALCENLIQCSFYKPILCSTGQCVSAIEHCPLIAAADTTYLCPANYVKCPGSGSCARHPGWCPTLRSCVEGEIRCANGQCYPLIEGQIDSCPAQARNVIQCQNGLIQCPVTNTGTMCRPTLFDCPTDVTCPAATPFRCESNQCASSPSDCAYMSATAIPDTRIACGMGTWASSAQLCGTPPSCPKEQPILCLDGTCRQTPNDCPENNECPSNLPFKCASGECQLNSYSCSLFKCTDPAKPVRCPYSTSTTRCVDDVNKCKNIFDANLQGSFTSLCTFGQRCWDGSCVSESRLCPQRKCSAEAPFLCPNGGCALQERFCRTNQGCPWDLPFFCKFTSTCVAKENECNEQLPGAITCAAPVTEEGETPPDNGLVLCDDGTCRTKDECFTTGPFGCPPETPIRCADGSCVPTPTAVNPVPQCKTASDTNNACPAHRPYRCPGGLCSTSSTRCPIFPALSSATQNSGVCRSASYTVKDEKDKDVKINIDMTVTCDDGSCAYSLAECPIIKPCGPKQFRCGDGTCRDLPGDPTSPVIRQRYADVDYMGAKCPAVNTCPAQLPYRCQSGECAQNRDQCISQFPLKLKKCCTSSADYMPSSSSLNPQGEDLGTCTIINDPIQNPCVDAEQNLETNLGCPEGMKRCDRGHCVPLTFGTDLCDMYNQAFSQLGDQTQTCIFRCSSGKCVDSASKCTVDNGCPLNTPILCSNGQCIAEGTTCPTSACDKVRCPGTNGSNGKCVDSIDECTTPLGCPLDAPILCADGTCKPYPASQSGMTVQPYGSFAPVGIAPDVCQPTLGCSGFTKYLCGDGSCQVDASQCPPIMATCPGLCRVTCPLTNVCVQLTSSTVNGVSYCDFSSMFEQCNLVQNACPSVRPFLCPSGACVTAPTQCSSPLSNDARTKYCPKSAPLRCANGACVSRPFECIKMTALVQQESPSDITPTTTITNTNVCASGYVCPDGLCVKDAVLCAPLPSCPFGHKRCEDGTCQAPVLSGSTWTDPVCPEEANADFKSECSGGQRCADGLCRTSGTCPVVLGCSGATPISCAWNKDDRCVDSISKCPGFTQTASEFQLTSTSVAAFSAYSSSELYRFEQLQQTFPQLNMQAITAIFDAMDQEVKAKYQLRTLQSSSGSFQPDQSTVQTCYQNCERDIPATPSTTLVTPTSTINNLVVSANQYSIPRTTINIASGSVNRTSEFKVYAVPEQLFTASSQANVGFATEFTWSEPTKARPKSVQPSTSEFSSKVISTPFACSLQVNNTEVKPQLAMSVGAYVDTQSYASTTGAEVDETTAEFPCAYLGTFDSALVGSGCGGVATIVGGTMNITYDAKTCGWGPSENLSFIASLSSIQTIAQQPDSIPWNGQTARQVLCLRIDSSTRKFSDGNSIVGSEFCATFVRVTDLIQITFPNNFLVEPNTTTNLLTQEDLVTSLTVAPSDTTLQTIANAQAYDTESSTNDASSTCSTSSSDISQIAKEDICLGYYDYATYTWQCLNPTNEERLGSPTWINGMRLNYVTASLPDCDKDAYAFLYIPLPEPVPIEEKFCFWCKYGWIILLVCILFVVILLVVVFFAMKFYRDRMKYKEEQKKLKGLQEHAADLAENQGGLGVADADGEINMTVNPLVLQLQDLNKQLEDANLKLDTIGKEEEYHIQRLQQQRQRIQAEIQRLEQSLANDESAKLAPKRVDVPVSNTAATGGPTGPVRTGGQQGASGPSTVGGATGPMRAPPK